MQTMVAGDAGALLDWYYMRLLITVAPEQVLERPPGSAAGPAQALRAGTPAAA